MLKRPLVLSLSVAATSIASGAIAQPAEEFREDEPSFFAEATGAYGAQLGETSYLPDGAVDEYRYPLVHGFGIGAAVGWFFMPDVALTAGYEFTSARSVVGKVDGLIDRTQGFIEYHALMLGLRLYQKAGVGSIRAEFGIGLILPYSTELELEYAPELAAASITGTGTQTENFALGYGAHAALGYEFPVTGPLYLATSLRLKVFQSSNNDETTELDNFLTTLLPPTVSTTEIEHGEGAEAPTTHSVQDLRLQLAVGARF